MTQPLLLTGDRGAVEVREGGTLLEEYAVDFFCGLGGWAEGFLSEGFQVVGFDNVRHDYGTGGYPGQLVLQDIRTLHGSQFASLGDRLRCFVASPPCTEYSYMAMPWKRAKQIARALRGQDSFPSGYKGSRSIEELNLLFNECFRLQREASEAMGRHIPLIVENVKGAQPWVGRSAWNFGSYHLWGDVPALMPTAGQVKVAGLDWSAFGKPGYKAQGFNVTAAQRHGEGVKQSGSGREWFAGEGKISRMTSSKSDSRKAASAAIAKIPFPLASHIAQVFKSQHDAEQTLRYAASQSV